MEVAAAIQEVHALLSDPGQLPTLHPLINTIKITGLREESGEKVTDVLIFERLPMAGLRMPNRYRAEFRVTPGNPTKLGVEAYSFPRVRVSSEFLLKSTPHGTRVVMKASYGAPWPLQGYVVQTANRAHDELALRIVAHFAERSLKRA